MTRHSPLASPKATIERLAEQGIGTRKSLGQHFLVDDGVLGRILRLAAVEDGEHILEVGPGIGTLTSALLERGTTVTAIEKDARLLPALADVASRYPGRLTLLHADALDWLAGAGAGDAGADSTAPAPNAAPPLKLVANLPYAVAATVVLDCFCVLDALQSATVMVQREVAERMGAQPGSKSYGAYTVKLGLLAQPGPAFAVSRASFLPPPRVDSTVIRLDRRAPHERPAPHEREAMFFVVEAAFAERRKTIRNSMRSHFSQQGHDPAQVDALLAAANIPAAVRGESLTLEHYRSLGTALLKLRDT